MTTLGDDKLRVLAVFCNPKGTDSLRLQSEQRILQRCLPPSTAALHVQPAATLDDLRQALLQQRYDIVHFSGHGCTDGPLLRMLRQTLLSQHAIDAQCNPAVRQTFLPAVSALKRWLQGQASSDVSPGRGGNGGRGGANGGGSGGGAGGESRLVLTLQPGTIPRAWLSVDGHRFDADTETRRDSTPQSVPTSPRVSVSAVEPPPTATGASGADASGCDAKLAGSSCCSSTSLTTDGWSSPAASATGGNGGGGGGGDSTELTLQLSWADFCHHRVGALAFEAQNGSLEPPKPDVLARLLASGLTSSSHLLGAGQPPRCGVAAVFLNACETAIQARQLLAVGVPAVIYCDGRISDAAASEFSRGFYEALASGCAVPQAYEQGQLAVELRFEHEQHGCPQLLLHQLEQQREMMRGGAAVGGTGRGAPPPPSLLASAAERPPTTQSRPLTQASTAVPSCAPVQSFDHRDGGGGSSGSGGGGGGGDDGSSGGSGSCSDSSCATAHTAAATTGVAYGALEFFEGESCAGKQPPLQELVPMPGSHRMAVCDSEPRMVRDAYGKLHPLGHAGITVPVLEAALPIAVHMATHDTTTPLYRRVVFLLGRGHELQASALARIDHGECGLALAHLQHALQLFRAAREHAQSERGAREAAAAPTATAADGGVGDIAAEVPSGPRVSAAPANASVATASGGTPPFADTPARPAAGESSALARPTSAATSGGGAAADLAEASAALARLPLYPQLRVELGEADTLLSLGVVCLHLRQADDGMEYARQSAALYTSLQASAQAAQAQALLAELLVLGADYNAAEEQLCSALRTFGELDCRLGLAEAHRQLGALRLLLGDTGGGRRQLREAVRLARDLPSPFGVNEALRLLGEGAAGAVAAGAPAAAADEEGAAVPLTATLLCEARVEERGKGSRAARALTGASKRAVSRLRGAGSRSGGNAAARRDGTGRGARGAKTALPAVELKPREASRGKRCAWRCCGMLCCDVDCTSSHDDDEVDPV